MILEVLLSIILTFLITFLIGFLIRFLVGWNIKFFKLINEFQEKLPPNHKKAKLSNNNSY